MSRQDVDEVTLQLGYDLQFVLEHWEQLLELRIPGTARPWRQPLMDPRSREVMAARDREERAVRDPDAPGFTLAPNHIDVLSVVVDVWVTVDELATRIAATLHQPQRRPADLRKIELLDAEQLETIRVFFETAAAHNKRLRTLAQKLGRLTGEVTRALSIVRPGQLLDGAMCPWCLGVTDDRPEGGATTMRVEEIAAARPANEHRSAIEAVYAVVCWNPTCTPPETDVHNWHHTRPAWPAREWDWLAERLIVAQGEWDRLGNLVVEVAPDGGDQVAPVDHSPRPGVSVMPCPQCVYVEQGWQAIGHARFDPCPAIGCGSLHFCWHRARGLTR